MTRRRFSERDCARTWIIQGADLRCFRSGEPITLENVGTLEREHLHEVALGGADDPTNCRYSLAAQHHIITNGTKATSAGSSKHRIAKVDRLAKGPRERKGREIQGAGFRPAPPGYKHFGKRPAQSTERKEP